MIFLLFPHFVLHSSFDCTCLDRQIEKKEIDSFEEREYGLKLRTPQYMWVFLCFSLSAESLQTQK